MKTPKSILLIFILLLASAGYSQELILKANLFNQQFPQEKIYLHLDRPSYWANDDIWFKAYLKNTPLPTSNLYVELVNERGAVVYKKICWVEGGLSYGDIHLADTLSSGMYQLRAYTNWIRNFDEQWFFRKDLVIWNLRDKVKSPQLDELKARKVDFQFMPEGGTFLAGVKNKVAFKAIDHNGKGVDAEGVVLDRNKNQVARIKSGFKGMGSFEITPQAGMTYTAELTIAGDILLKVGLPSALVSGVAMNINPEDSSRIHIEINEQGGTANETYQVIGQSEGNICYQGEVTIQSGKGVLDITKEKFPTGIVRLTLFDKDQLPRCERLVFINHHDQINITIEPEQAIYHPRDNVVLDISTLGKDEAPLLSNLSLTVYHTETTAQTEIYPENILTRFLISSELKGRIEEPAYYFKDDSLSTSVALDNLLLTHGYRYFDWKQVMDNHQPVIEYQPEASMQLKGTVYSWLLYKPVPHAKVTMLTAKSHLMVREQTTDSLGRFVFPDLFFNDSLHVVLQCLNPNGKNNSTLEIDKRSSTSPKANILPATYQYSEDGSSNTVTYISQLSPEFLNRKWRLSDTILLADVNVMARKKKKDDGHVRPYGEADYVIEASKIDDVYGNIFDALEMSPQFRYYSTSGKGVVYFLDGIQDKNGLIANTPVSWIDKVEMMRMVNVPGMGLCNGIFFYTKRGPIKEEPEFTLGIVPAKMVGYSVIRNYYSPVYDGSNDPEKGKNDYRSLLYWNPIVKTDVEGLASVSFYNSDLTGQVKIVAEGVTKDGKLCRGLFNYEVVPK